MTAKIHNKTRLRYVVHILLPLLMWSMAAQAQRLTEYLPASKTDVAVVVCPGGSYCWLSKKYEGSEVGKWLAENGIAAYVLEYPTAGWAAFAFHTRWFYRGHQHPDALNALGDAIRQIDVLTPQCAPPFTSRTVGRASMARPCHVRLAVYGATCRPY